MINAIIAFNDDMKPAAGEAGVTAKPADGFGRAQQGSAVFSSVGERGTGKPPLGGTAPIGPRVAVVPLHSYPRRGLTGIYQHMQLQTIAFAFLNIPLRLSLRLPLLCNCIYLCVYLHSLVL